MAFRHEFWRGSVDDWGQLQLASKVSVSRREEADCGSEGCCLKSHEWLNPLSPMQDPKQIQLSDRFINDADKKKRKRL